MPTRAELEMHPSAWGGVDTFTPRFEVEVVELPRRSVRYRVADARRLISWEGKFVSNIPWVVNDQAVLSVYLTVGKAGNEQLLDLSEAASISCALLHEDGTTYKTLTCTPGSSCGQPVDVAMVGIDVAGRYQMRFTVFGPEDNRITVPSPSRLYLDVRSA